MTIRCAILTISDRCSSGIRTDTSGPALKHLASTLGWEITATRIIPDEVEIIKEQLVAWSDSYKVDVILTTGGTGFSPRDVTPEATAAVVEKNAPGLAEFMRAESIRVTPHGMLSRGICGIRKKALIINLPGSEKAAVENIQSISSVIPHAIALLQEDPTSEKGHRYQT